MEKLLIVIVLMVGVIAVAQMMKVYQISSKLRGKKEEEISLSDNKFNANMMLAFMSAFYLFFFWLLSRYGNGGIGPSASEHGEELDWLLNFNFLIIIIVFFITNSLLFVFAYKYYHRPDRKAYWFPHNNKLELLWTSVPAVVLAVIIILGLRSWNKITDDAPKDATVIEVYSKQFDWTARYAGVDNKLGRADFRMNSSNNPLGVLTQEALKARLDEIQSEIDTIQARLDKPTNVFSAKKEAEMIEKIDRLKRHKIKLGSVAETLTEKEDKAAWDDKVTKEIVLIKGKEYEFKFRSMDVIHSAYFPHFRAQMNTVPGMVTRLKFKPIISTKEMKKKMNDEKFEYVLLCNKICGAAHSNMQMKVTVVEDQKEYDAWLATQKPFKDTSTPAVDSAPAIDTVATQAVDTAKTK